MTNNKHNYSGINIASMNCRGLGNSKKRRDVLDFFKRSRFNIICLQDTHLTKEKEVFTKTVWRGRAFFHRSQTMPEESVSL